MTSKISAVLAAALILGSASLASAANSKPQAVRQQPRHPSVMLLEDGAKGARAGSQRLRDRRELHRQAERMEVTATPRVA